MSDEIPPADLSTAHLPDVMETRDRSIGTLAKNLRRQLWTARVPVTVAVSLAVFGLQAIHSILLARLLGPVGRGEYGTTMFFAQTMIYIGLWGTHYSIARIAAQDSTQHTQVQRSAFLVGLFTGTLSLVIAILLSVFGLPADKQYLLPLCIICAFLLPAEHLRLTAQAVDHGRGNFNRYNLSRLFAASVFPVLVLLLYCSGFNNLSLIASCTVIVSCVGYLFYLAISDCKNVLGGDHQTAIRMIREGRSDGLLVLANDLYDRLTILLVIWLASLSSQGLFLTAIPVASLLLVAPNAFELFAFRAAADPEKRLTMGALIKSTCLVILFQLAVLSSLQIVLKPLITVLFTEEFEGAIPIARVVMFALAFNGLTIVGEGYLRGRGLAKLGVWTRIVAVIVMLGMLFVQPAASAVMKIVYAALGGHIVNATLVGLLVFKDVKRLEDVEAANA